MKKTKGYEYLKENPALFLNFPKCFIQDDNKYSIILKKKKNSVKEACEMLNKVKAVSIPTTSLSLKYTVTPQERNVVNDP